jgi:hypothetical protein
MARTSASFFWYAPSRSALYAAISFSASAFAWRRRSALAAVSKVGSVKRRGGQPHQNSTGNLCCCCGLMAAAEATSMQHEAHSYTEKLDPRSCVLRDTACAWQSTRSSMHRYCTFACFCYDTRRLLLCSQKLLNAIGVRCHLHGVCCFWGSKVGRRDKT